MGRKAIHHARFVPNNQHAVCGKRVIKAVRSRYRGGGTATTHLAVAEYSTWPDRTTCAPCLRWLAMTEEERAVLAVATISKKRAAFEKMKMRAEEKRLAKAKSDHALVADMRADALVMIDAVLEGREYERADEVLAAAMIAHRILHPASRGKRLWVFRAVSTADSRRYTNNRDVACRFCNEILGESLELGKDWSTHTLVRPDGGYVSVSRHTTLCALAFLSESTMPEPLV